MNTSAAEQGLVLPSDHKALIGVFGLYVRHLPYLYSVIHLTERLVQLCVRKNTNLRLM